jgi:hypothetical protein
MKILNIVLTIALALLSIAAGIAKVLQTPQEVEFLQSFGFSPMLIIIFGVAQILGGVLLAVPKTVQWGAIITFSGFAVSSVLIFIAGDLIFALVSMLPLALAGFIYSQSSKIIQRK